MNKSIISIILIGSLFTTISFANAANFTESNQLVKSPNSATVYLIKSGYRYSFPLQKIYETYYGNDFSTVTTISEEDLAKTTLRGNVLLSENALVKMESSPKIYSVTKIDDDLLTAYLRWIQDEQEAFSLFGQNWKSEIISIPDSMWFNYKEVPYFESYSLNSSSSGEYETNQWLEILRFKTVLYNNIALPLNAFIGNFNDPYNLPDFDQCYLNYSFDQIQWFSYDNDPHYPDYSRYGGIPAYIFANDSLIITPRKEVYFSWNCFIPDTLKGYSGKATLSMNCPIYSEPTKIECISNAAIGNTLSFK